MRYVELNGTNATPPFTTRPSQRMKIKTLNKEPSRLLISLTCLLCATVLHAAQLVTVPDPSHHLAAGGNGDSALPLVSHDGRFVLFSSSADNLSSANTNAPLPSEAAAQLNVFLRDRSNAVTALVSVNLAGTGGGNYASFPAGISTNGRYVLLETSASNLVAGDTNNAPDVLVRDLQAGMNILVSAVTNGLPGNGASSNAVMTPDGRYIAFISAASNLVAGDTNGIPDVFVRDLVTGTTVLASVGAQSAKGMSEAPQITPDGRYVAFFSTATNLVPGVPDDGGDVYMRDLAGNTTVWASSHARTALQSFQNATNPVCFGHVISADGKFVAYEVCRSLAATNWMIAAPLPSVTNGIVMRYTLETGLTDIVCTNAAILSGAPADVQTLAMTPDGRFIAFIANPNSSPGMAACVYVWDGLSNATTLVSGDLTGAVPTNDMSIWPAITPDGRFVAFQSTATNLVTNSLVGEFHVYVRDLQAGITQLVDADTNGIGSGVTGLTVPQITEDGRFVAFEADDGRLVPNDSNRLPDVFVRDLVAGTTDLISKRDPALPGLTPDGPSTLASLSVSAEGSLVAFTSAADDLVLNDTNGYPDVYVRNLLFDSTLLVSVDASGTTSGNGPSGEATISSDGRFVAFSSSASNLVAGDTNNASDVFVRDLLTGTTALVSVNLNGFSGNGASYTPIITSDGRAVLFRSLAKDLVPGSFGDSYEHLFWRELGPGTTYALSVFNNFGLSPTPPVAVTPDGHFVAFGGQRADWYVWDSQLHATVYSNTVPAGNVILALSISPDGNRIAYALGIAYGSLTPGLTNLYLVDRAASSLKLLGSVQSVAHGVPRFSADGRYLAYVTRSVNVPADTNGLNDVYLYDCLTSSNTLVSQPYDAPVSANGDSDSPDISPDGRFVAYRSAASNLVPGDFNGLPDVFLWERLTGATMLLSVSQGSDSSANNRSLTPVFSGDGNTVFFETWASDLVPYDFNRGSDIFAVSLLSSGAVPLFRTAIAPGTGPGIWISWPAVVGKSYRLQFKNTLTDPAWQDLAGIVTLVGTHAYLNDLAVPGSQRFYRVIAQ
jgi:Tol biopolymer transport system component